MALNPNQATTLAQRVWRLPGVLRCGGRRTGRAVAALALAPFLATPLAAEPVAPAEIADVAMRVCIRATPDASAGVQAKDFSVRSRVGQTFVYEHDAGPRMTLTSRPGFFNCDMEIPDVEAAYLASLISELRTEIERRFGTIDAHRDANGMQWQFTTEDDVVVSIDVAERDDGAISISSSADAAPLTPPTQ